MPDKPNFALLIGKKKDPESDPMESDLKGADGMDGPMAEESACKDMMSALKTGDTKLFSAALKDFIEMQDGEPDGDEAAPPVEGAGDQGAE